VRETESVENSAKLWKGGERVFEIRSQALRFEVFPWRRCHEIKECEAKATRWKTRGFRREVASRFWMFHVEHGSEFGRSVPRGTLKNACRLIAEC